MRRTIARLIVASATLYTGVVGSLFLDQRDMLYFPEATRADPARWGVGDMDPITVKTADGLSLTGWYRAPQDAARPTIILFHGNAGHIGQRAFKARRYLDARYGVMLASYRGWGSNLGKPSETGLYADARAFLDYLHERGIESHRVVLYGESLGTGVAVQMATERPVAGVVLESPYTTIADIALHRFPWIPVSLLVLDRFDSLSKIRRIGAPLLVIHGERDLTIPIDFGRQLFEAATVPKRALWLPFAGHLDVYDYGADRGVLEFLEFLVHAGPDSAVVPPPTLLHKRSSLADRASEDL